MKRVYRLLMALTAIALLLLNLLSCTGGAHQSKHDKPVIAVTIAPTAELIHTLVGDEVEVLVLLPEGATPESYEPSMQDMQRLATTDVWCYVGDLGFERSWLERIKELNPQIRLVRLDQGLNHIRSEHQHGKELTHTDPHYWASIEGIKVMTENLVAMLQAQYPDLDPTAGKAAIAQQLAILQGQLEALKKADTKGFVIYHPSLTYLAREANLVQLVIEQEGKEPTVQQLNHLITTARQLDSRVMFFQKEFGANLRSSDYIRDELGLQVVQINPFSPDWFAELSAIYQRLSEDTSVTASKGKR